jgi:hypothetical protein
MTEHGIWNNFLPGGEMLSFLLMGQGTDNPILWPAEEGGSSKQSHFEYKSQGLRLKLDHVGTEVQF